MATPAVTPQATAWDENGQPVQAQQPAATGATAWDEQGNPVQQQAPPTQSDPDEIPETSYGEATWGAVKNLGKDTVGAVKGAAKMLDPRPQDPDEKDIQQGVGGTGAMLIHRMVKGLGDTAIKAEEIPAAIHDINQSADPMGTYAKILQKTASEGAGQAVTALATEGAIKAPGAIKSALPSAERAGQALEEVKAAAGDVPLAGGKLGKMSDTVGEIMKQDERGAPAPAAVKQLAKRLESGEPLTYEEAKDFQSNISALSAQEKMGMSANTKRLVGQLNQDMKGALQDAAATKNAGAKFSDAMKEYHKAMKVSEMTDEAKALAIKGALAASFGAAGTAGYMLYKKLFD